MGLEVLFGAKSHPGRGRKQCAIGWRFWFWNKFCRICARRARDPDQNDRTDSLIIFGHSDLFGRARPQRGWVAHLLCGLCAAFALWCLLQILSKYHRGPCRTLPRTRARTPVREQSRDGILWNCLRFLSKVHQGRGEQWPKSRSATHPR